ncbi:hypothetical protein VTI28DRAFT_4442 [Corynascus sepedonium]
MLIMDKRTHNAMLTGSRSRSVSASPPEKELPSGSATPAADVQSKGEGTISEEDGGQADGPPSTQKAPRDVHGVKWVLIAAIVNEFGDLTLLPWLSVIRLYAGAASTLLMWGKGYGVFNCKWIYIGTTALFEVGSAVCGAAPSMNALIVGRAICGLGGAGMYLGVMSILSMLTSPVERPTYLGMVGLTWGAGTVLGPIIGGAFTDSSATWRWAFYINLCIGGLFAPGPSRIIGMFLGSAIAFVLFFCQQGFMWLTSYSGRIFPMQYLKSKGMLLIFVETAAAETSSFVPIYFIPLYFQFVKGDGALDAGVRLLPFIVPMVVFNLVNGVGMSALGYYMPWYVLGGALVLVGGVLLKIVNLFDQCGSHLWCPRDGRYWYRRFLAGRFRRGAVFGSSRGNRMAVGFMTCAQVGGSTIALSIANTIFLNRATTQITQILPDKPGSAVQAMISGANRALLRSLDGAVRTDVRNAIVTSITDALTLDVTAEALTLVVALFLRRGKMNQAHGHGTVIVG